MEETKLINLTDNNSANLVFDLINCAEKYGNQKIDMIICNDEYWFKGKDIATILGYKNTKQSLIDHVKSNNKKTMERLYNNLRGHELRPLTANQKNTIYINEAGLYQLIMKSKLDVAEQFQDWVTGDLLPKVRKLGQEKYLEQLKQSQLLLAEKDQQLREAEERAEHQKRGMDQIRQFIENSKVREMNEKIYIAFCPLDAKQNIFKVGGCQSAALLKTRLSTYNSPQSNDNLYAFAAVWNCHKFAEVENRIKQIIGEFRQDGKKEVYLMHYNCLFTIIDFIVNHYNEENEAVNNFIRTIVQNMTELKPVVPEPYQLDRVELVEVRNGEEVKRDIICLDNMSAQEQEALITDLVRRFRKPEQTTIRRSEFEDFIKMSGVQKFKKRTVWDHLKKIAAEIADLSLVY